MPKKFYDIIPPEKEEIEERPLEKKLRKKFSLLRGVIFFSVLFIALIIFGFFFFQKAVIDIWPQTFFLTLEEKITVDSTLKIPDFEKKIFSGEVFENQESISREFSASGKILKKEKAKGILTVYNEDTSVRSFVPSRFVSADGKLFWSTEKIKIPGAGYEKGRLVPGKIDIEVVAAEPGPDYNIGPTTFALPALAGGPLYTTIYAKSSSAMTSGFLGEIPQVIQEDLDKAKNILTEEAKSKSREMLKKNLSPGFTLIEETISQEVLESLSSVEPGAEGESFSFQVKVGSRAIGFVQSEIESFVEKINGLNIEEGRKVQEETLEINYFLESSDLESGKINLRLEIKAKTYFDINGDEIKKALLGKGLDESKLFLENLQGIERIEVRSWPFLKRKIPQDMEKVEINLMLEGVD